MYDDGMQVTTRCATADDAESIHELIVALARFEREPDAVEVTPETLRAQLATRDPPFECVLAEAPAGVVGFALFYRTYSTWRGRPGVHLEDLFVVESHRRAGVATALLSTLAAIVLERGWGRLEWSVLDWNRSAIDFYEHIGARRLREWLPYRLDGAALSTLAARRDAP